MATTKKILLFAALLCLHVQVFSFAQGGKNEEDLVKQLASNKFTETVISPNALPETVVQQTGDQNTVAVHQRNLATKNSSAFLLQVGNYNRLTLQQQGQGNKTTARQIGNHNTYAGNIDGNNNSSNVLQQGDGNTINQRVSGNHLEYTLLQQGNNNTITQVETTLDAKPYQVVQQGNNLKITVEQSNWGAPVSSNKN